MLCSSPARRLDREWQLACTCLYLLAPSEANMRTYAACGQHRNRTPRLRHRSSSGAAHRLRAMRLGGASYSTTPSCCSPHRPVAAGLCTQLSPRGHNTPQLTPSSSQHHTTSRHWPGLCCWCACVLCAVTGTRTLPPRVLATPPTTYVERSCCTSALPCVGVVCFLALPCVGVVCFLGSRARAFAAVAGLAAHRAP